MRKAQYNEQMIGACAVVVDVPSHFARVDDRDPTTTVNDIDIGTSVSDEDS
jgi:hypothetical protein